MKIDKYLNGESRDTNKDIIDRLTTSPLLPKDQWMNAAIYLYRQYFKKTKICIFGSTEPWLEAAVVIICINCLIFSYHYIM